MEEKPLTALFSEFAANDLLNSEFLECNKFSLIIPTFKEAKNLPELVRRIETSLSFSNFELVVVDDNSPDDTAHVALNMNKSYGNIRVLKRASKLGLSSAVIDGFGMAASEVQAFVVMDADMQHPPEILPKLFKEILKGSDLVIGSRYIAGGGVDGWRMSRRVISKLATFLVHLILPETKKVKDVLSGFFVVKRSVVSNIQLDPIGYKILLEILVKGHYQNVSEVPYIFEPRRNGQSNLNSKEIVNFLIQIGRLFKRKKNIDEMNVHSTRSMGFNKLQ